MLNLAHKSNQKEAQSKESGQVISFPKPSILQGAIVNTQKNEDGYTPLPNFICDEGYLAVLDGEAITCLVFLNRHIRGFHLPNKGMSETLVKKITGIKDGRTIQKYMADLEKYQIIRIQKERGKSNVYFLTFDDRLPTHHVGTFDDEAQHVPTCDVGTVPTQHVPTTTYMACGSVKEIYLKENIKENKKETSLVDNFKNDDVLKFIEYHAQDKNLYSLRELSNEYTLKSDFSAQAKIMNPDLTDEQILIEIRNFAQWSVNQNPRTAQDWLNNWIYRIEKFVKTKPKQAVAKPSKKNLSDSQIEMFSKKLCNLDDFASVHSNVGETQKQFESRIAIKLREPENIKKWSEYLKEVKFTGNVEGFV